MRFFILVDIQELPLKLVIYLSVKWRKINATFARNNIKHHFINFVFIDIYEVRKVTQIGKQVLSLVCPNPLEEQSKSMSLVLVQFLSN